MPNPFGITEVDIPGALGAYEAGQTSRVNRLLRQQQLTAAERQAERQQRFDSLLLGGNSDTGKGGAASAYTPATPQAEQTVSALHGLPAPAATAPAAPAPSQGINLPPEVMQQLAILEPEQAGQIFTALHTMDASQRERLSAANLYMANAAQHLLANVPEADWPAEIQRIAPDLAAHGISPQMLAGFQPTRRNLQYLIGQAMDVERLAATANPHPMAVTQGGSIVDTNRRPDPNTGVIAPIYESLTVEVQGMPYARPPQMRTPTVTAPVRELPPGFVVQGSTSAVAPSWPIAGGAAPGQPGFP